MGDFYFPKFRGLTFEYIRDKLVSDRRKGMDELKSEIAVLSNNVEVIAAEINFYQNIAGEAVFEIGKRLKHVKENDLVHGEWSKWCESIGMNRSNATIFIKVFEEIGGQDVVTLQHLGVRALYEIAQMPAEQREIPHTTTDGSEKLPTDMTIKELRETKAALKAAKQSEADAVASAKAEKDAHEATQARIQALNNELTQTYHNLTEAQDKASQASSDDDVKSANIAKFEAERRISELEERLADKKPETTKIIDEEETKRMEKRLHS